MVSGVTPVFFHPNIFSNRVDSVILFVAIRTHQINHSLELLYASIITPFFVRGDFDPTIERGYFNEYIYNKNQVFFLNA